jgi:hypothetical protein
MALRSFAMHVHTYLDGEDGVGVLLDLVEACNALGMSETPIDGPRGVRTPWLRAERAFHSPRDRGIYEALEFHTARQTAFLICLVPDDGLDWRALDTQWLRAAGTESADAGAGRVGRVRLYYALYEGDGAVGSLADLAGHALPGKEVPGRRSELFPGCHLWEVESDAEHAADRALVLLAPADAEAEQRSDDWVWPNGTYRLPPLPAYLWQMAKVRHEARRFEERRSSPVLFELTGRAARFERAEKLGGQNRQARDDELRALQRYTALASAGAAALRAMQRTVEASAENALAVLPDAGRDAADGVFAADKTYTDWLLVEITDEAAAAGDAVSYAGPMAALAEAAAEERRQLLTVQQTATIAAIGLFLAATQAIEYNWRTYASTQTPFVIAVLFFGLLVPLTAMSRPSGRLSRRWLAWVLITGTGLAVSVAWFAVSWVVRWQSGGVNAVPTLVVTVVTGLLAVGGSLMAWRRHTRNDVKERR